VKGFKGGWRIKIIVEMVITISFWTDTSPKSKKTTCLQLETQLHPKVLSTAGQI